MQAAGNSVRNGRGWGTGNRESPATARDPRPGHAAILAAERCHPEARPPCTIRSRRRSQGRRTWPPLARGQSRQPRTAVAAKTGPDSAGGGNTRPHQTAFDILLRCDVILRPGHRRPSACAAGRRAEGSGLRSHVGSRGSPAPPSRPRQGRTMPVGTRDQLKGCTSTPNTSTRCHPEARPPRTLPSRRRSQGRRIWPPLARGQSRQPRTALSAATRPDNACGG